MRYMCVAKGMYSMRSRQSATAIEVRIKLIGLDLIVLSVRTIMLRELKITPMKQTERAKQP